MVKLPTRETGPEDVDAANLDWGSAPTCIDVRSPAEFAAGHIPGAHNVPLFSDEERAEVGTLYKQESKQAAIDKGLEFVGPKLAWLVRQIRELGGEQPLVYCWRGGMRSDSLCHLMRISGLPCRRLAGGYKAYRRHIREVLCQPAPLLVLGGYTGSGKTALLHQLAAAKIQIIDLEGLAHHKGSAFGHINEKAQPTNEQFENNLFTVFQGLDRQRFILVENESRVIGKVHLPEPFYFQLRTAPLISLDVPKEARIARLVEDYAHTDKEVLIAAAGRISKKLGQENLKKVEEHIGQGEFAEACAILLRYYDVYYDRGVSKRKADSIYRLAISGTDLGADAALIKGKLAELEQAATPEVSHA